MVSKHPADRKIKKVERVFRQIKQAGGLLRDIEKIRPELAITLRHRGRRSRRSCNNSLLRPPFGTSSLTVLICALIFMPRAACFRSFWLAAKGLTVYRRRLAEIGV